MTLSNFQAYLLAAGNGRRAGGPKAWMDYQGQSLLERQVRFLLKVFAPGDAAISIQKDWMSRCEKISRDILWIPVDLGLTPLGAFQELVRAAPLRKWAFLYHVDMPVWEAGLFNMLAARAAAAGGSGLEAIAPVHEGRKGHPVLLSSGLGPSLLSLDPAEDRLDHWLRMRKEAALEVPFACIRENWNNGFAGPGSVH